MCFRDRQVWRLSVEAGFVEISSAEGLTLIVANSTRNTCNHKLQRGAGEFKTQQPSASKNTLAFKIVHSEIYELTL